MKIRINKWLVILFFAAVALDFFTKLLIKEYVPLFGTIPVITGFFNIVHALNPGAAFGFMRNLDDSYRQIFFVTITVAAMVMILFVAMKERSKLAIFAYTLILAGACGNLIDRIHTSYVVDFLDFRIGEYVWPAFNVADICITVGVALLLLQIIIFSRHTAK